MSGPWQSSTTVDRRQPRVRSRRKGLPTLRIGVVSGLVAILCCVGPTALALVGLISGATAYGVATELYANWAWGFRLAGIAAAAGLAWWALRRRDACSLVGLRRSWPSLVLIVVVGGVTYVALYAFTTWLGTFAT